MPTENKINNHTKNSPTKLVRTPRTNEPRPCKEKSNLWNISCEAAAKVINEAEKHSDTYILRR